MRERQRSQRARGRSRCARASSPGAALVSRARPANQPLGVASAQPTSSASCLVVSPGQQVTRAGKTQLVQQRVTRGHALEQALEELRAGAVAEPVDLLFDLAVDRLREAGESDDRAERQPATECPAAGPSGATEAANAGFFSGSAGGGPERGARLGALDSGGPGESLEYAERLRPGDGDRGGCRNPVRDPRADSDRDDFRVVREELDDRLDAIGDAFSLSTNRPPRRCRPASA
jgi:hypothetical protein